MSPKQQQQRQQQPRSAPPRMAAAPAEPASRPALPDPIPPSAANAAARRPLYVPRAGDEDFAAAIAREMIDPATIGVDFNDIAGQEEAKEALQEAVIFPALMPDYFIGMIRPAKGVLLYGPPGTGKSMLAKAVASQGNITFFNVSPATISCKTQEDSEKIIRVLFDMARHYAPSVVFIDEIDALCGPDRRTLKALEAQMNRFADANAPRRVTLLAATSRPWDIDEAMRCRIFERRVHVTLPEHKERVTLLNLLVSKQSNVKIADDVDFEALSGELEGMLYSAADLSLLAREAVLMPMRRYVAENRVAFMKNRQAAQEAIEAVPVTIQDFRAATKRAPPSTDAAQLTKLAQSGAEHFGVPSLPDGSAEDTTQRVEHRPGDSGNHSTAREIKPEFAAQVAACVQQLMRAEHAAENAVRKAAIAANLVASKAAIVAEIEAKHAALEAEIAAARQHPEL